MNEPGLYRLIFTSRKKEAEIFKTWVFTEVLPAIRRTGQYSVTGTTAGLDAALAEISRTYQATLTELRALRRETDVIRGATRELVYGQADHTARLAALETPATQTTQHSHFTDSMAFAHPRDAVAAFFATSVRFTGSGNDRARISELLAAYQRWCNTTGVIPHYHTTTTLGKALRRVMPTIRPHYRRPVLPTGREICYVGHILERGSETH